MRGYTSARTYERLSRVWSRWGFRGAAVGLLLGIAWNVSRSRPLVAVKLSGLSQAPLAVSFPHGSAPLSFAWLVVCGLGGLVAGVAFVAIAAGARAGRDVLRR